MFLISFTMHAALKSSSKLYCDPLSRFVAVYSLFFAGQKLQEACISFYDIDHTVQKISACV